MALPHLLVQKCLSAPVALTLIFLQVVTHPLNPLRGLCKNFVLVTHLVLDLAPLAEGLGDDAFASFTGLGVGIWHYDSMFLSPTHFPAS